MTGLFDKIKKRAGLKGQADAKSAEVEFGPVETHSNASVLKSKKAVETHSNASVQKSEEKTEKKIFNNADRILIKPVVSEKASIAESFNAYSFIVAKDASKKHIKEAVQQIYGVKPEKVRIINVEGKELRVKTGSARRGDWKKAIVTLPKGQSINIHEGV